MKFIALFATLMLTMAMAAPIDPPAGTGNTSHFWVSKHTN